LGNRDAFGSGLCYVMSMTVANEQTEDFAGLYYAAFARYGVRALWNKRAVENPTVDDALVVARALRAEGDREARKLAELIECACRAAA
jgi:hypothetical protein